MVLASLAFALVADPSLSFADGAFTIKQGEETVKVPLSVAKVPVQLHADKLSLRIGDTLISFDQRGLGIQYRGKGGFTNLPSIATSPKIFNAEEAKRVAQFIAEGSRTANVSALSGFEVVDDNIYLLMRWDEKDGKPWLEALIEVDTNGDTPSTKVLARFGGFTFAKGKVSDELYSRDKALYSPLKATLGLALGSFDLAKGEQHFTNLGPIPDHIAAMGQHFYTTKATNYGLTSVGYLDVASAKWRPVLETRGEVVPTSLTDTLRLSEEGGNFLFSPETGAKVVIPVTSAVAECPQGVLVWFPADKPTNATLRARGSLLTLADWKRS